MEALSGTGLDVPGLLQSAGIDPGECVPGGTLPLEGLRAFWKAATDAGSPTIGLRAAEHVRLASFDVIGYLVKNSATSRDAMRRAQRYAGFGTERSGSEIVHDGDRVLVKYHHADRVPRILSDFLLGAAFRMGRECQGAAFSLIEVRIHYEAPPEADAYNAWFGVPVRFGCGYNALVSHANVLDRRHEDADEELCRILERQAEQQLARFWESQGFAARVRRALRGHIQQGEVGVPLVAEQLQVSPRTLRRRLHEEGTSYARLLDELRHELALRYLKEGRGRGEIASLLGFTQTAAFTRALKRWTRSAQPSSELQA